jgi:hypothetical protein
LTPVNFDLDEFFGMMNMKITMIWISLSGNLDNENMRPVNDLDNNKNLIMIK